jgi:hypothetical protein
MTLPRKIAALLVAMEAGHEITLTTGHKLALAEEYDEPGFVVFNTSNQTEMVMQIGSEVAWMSLIGYAKTITTKDIEDIEKTFRS